MTDMKTVANWIWLPPEKYPESQKAGISAFSKKDVQQTLAVFRREIIIDQDVFSIEGCWSAEPRFRFFINGRFIDDGPVEPGGDYGCTEPCGWHFMEKRDLSAFFHTGRNVVSFEVYTTGLSQTDYSCGLPGLHADFTISTDSGIKHVFTNDSWRCAVDPAGKNYPGIWDGETGLDAPHDCDFDDSGWCFASMLPRPERRNITWDLPPLNNIPVQPAGISINGRQIELPAGISPLPQVLELEFADEIAGHFAFDIYLSVPARINIVFQERKGLSSGTESYLGKKGRQLYRSPRLYAFKYITLQFVFGGFYCDPPYAEIHGITAYSRGFCLPETLDFSCSESGLMKVRNSCDRALRLCMQRLHLDSPVHQEGLGCTGDYMIESAMSYALYGERRLARADLKRTAMFLEQHNGRMFHTLYTLCFIRMLYEYYMETGDMETLKECSRGMALVLERFNEYTGTEKLVSQSPDYLFIDWVFAGEGITLHHPPASMGMGVFTGFYIKALEYAAKLTEFCGGDPEIYIQRRKQSANAVEMLLWDEKTGVYIDGIPGLNKRGCSKWLPLDTENITSSPHTSIAMLAAGIVPEHRRNRLLEKIVDGKFEIGIQMYYMHYLFDALEACGCFEKYGMELLKRFIPAVEEHPWALKEAWHGGDYCHAWGGTPAVQIQRQILGIKPLTPGYEKTMFSPHFCGMEQVKGTVRTPRGDIHVKWENGTITLKHPKNMEIKYGHLPTEKLTVLQ